MFLFWKHVDTCNCYKRLLLAFLTRCTSCPPRHVFVKKKKSRADGGRAGQLSRSAWLRLPKASCSCVSWSLSFPLHLSAPALPSISSPVFSLHLSLPLPVDQHSVHAKPPLHRAQSTVDEQMSLFFFFFLSVPRELRHFKCTYVCFFCLFVFWLTHSFYLETNWCPWWLDLV